jgi:hypothetical protein
MMNLFYNSFTVIILTVTFSLTAYSQKDLSGVNSINTNDLESHVSFLASPLLKGRVNGGESLEIAAQYLATQAKLIGLKPGNGESYFQPYTVMEKLIDYKKSEIKIVSNNQDTVKISQHFFQLMPTGPSDFTLEGEVVFAGYGLKHDRYNYNDFEGITTEGKILLVMNSAPSSEDGKKFLFEGTQWSTFMGVQAKLTTLFYSKAKAVLFVMDPKSGYGSFEDHYPEIASQYGPTMSLKGEKPRNVLELPGMPKIVFIHRSIADELLKGTGQSLEDLQNNIDKNLKPHSFIIKEKRLRFTEVSVTKEKVLNNVAGYIEGRDPVLKNEFIIFSAHYDHIGEQGGMINAGADDDASGCAALLSIAKAVNSLEKKPLRSVLFLWVSGEEVGLFGSKSYVTNPLFPLNNTLVNLNMDMIGRVKSVAVCSSENHMSGPSSVCVITGNESKVLFSFAEIVGRESGMDFAGSG